MKHENSNKSIKVEFNHRERFGKLTFRALALCSDEGLTLETSAFQIFHVHCGKTKFSRRMDHFATKCDNPEEFWPVNLALLFLS